MPKEPAWYEFFQQQADMDPLAMVEQTFSRTKVGGSAVFAPIQDVGLLRLSLLSQDGLSQEEDKLLRKMLTHQLEISKRFSQVWINPKPDLRELMHVWQEQVEATDRWNVFMKHFEQGGNLQAAYQFAFVIYEPTPLLFQTEEEETHWLKLLGNEQQRMILLEQLLAERSDEPVCRLTGGELLYRGEIYRLTPTHFNLLERLWDELPHPNKELLAVLGRSVVSKDNVQVLAKWIYEVNGVLKEIWGVPIERKRWIQNCRIEADSAYRMTLPRERL
jgi:hypothetical protein